MIRPRDTAVRSSGFEADPSVRDTRVLMIAPLGRMGWQDVTGYGRRTEAIVGVAVLNRMLDAGRPNSVCRQASAA